MLVTGFRNKHRLLGERKHRLLGERGHRTDRRPISQAVPFLHWHSQVKSTTRTVRKQAVIDEPVTRGTKVLKNGRAFNIYPLSFAAYILAVANRVIMNHRGVHIFFKFFFNFFS